MKEEEKENEDKFTNIDLSALEDVVIEEPVRRFLANALETDAVALFVLLVPFDERRHLLPEPLLDKAYYAALVSMTRQVIGAVKEVPMWVSVDLPDNYNDKKETWLEKGTYLHVTVEFRHIDTTGLLPSMESDVDRAYC